MSAERWTAYTVPMSIPDLPVPEMPAWLLDALERTRIGLSGDPRLGMELRYGMPNIMPRFDWWPWIDKAITARDELRVRVPAAWETLRYGVPDDRDDW